jgi:type I restriction enzyme R subunit
LLEALVSAPNAEARHQTIGDLRAMIRRIPTDSFPVKKVLTEIEEAWSDSFWQVITRDKIEFLRLKVAPLLRFAADVDVAAEFFTNKVERLKLQLLRGQPSPDALTSIADDVSRLPDYVLQDSRCQDSVKLCLSQALAEANPGQLTKTITDLAQHMRNRRDRPSAFLTLDLPDFIATRGYISLGEVGQQIYVEEYRKRIESRILEIVANHPTLEAIRQGKEVTELELVELERTLHKDLGGGELQLSSSNFHKAYGVKVDSFLGVLRHVLALDTIPDYAAVVKQAFEKHIVAHRYSADQIRFLRAVQDVFIQKRKLELADLYEPPLTNFGRNAADRFFTPQELSELINFTNQIAA